jgi:hypothetical protein
LRLSGLCGEKPVEYRIDFDVKSDDSGDSKLLHMLVAKARLSELEIDNEGIYIGSPLVCDLI